MQRSNYCVYKHTCLAPGKSFGKVYIGITCQRKPEHRWNHGRNYRHCLYFDNAVKKYGWESFSHEILVTGLSRSEAKRMERKYIKNFLANDPKFGFNLTPGGDNLCGSENPVSRPVVAFDAVSGIRLYDYESIREAEDHLGGSPWGVLSGTMKTSHGVIYRYFDDVGLTMILPESECFRPRAQPMKEKPINQYGLDGKYIQTFRSIKDAEFHLGLSRDMVGNAVRGKSKSGGGYQWRFDNGDHSDIDQYVSGHKVRKTRGDFDGKHIEQIDLISGEVIAEYPSLRAATRAVNGNRRDISSVAKGGQGKKSAYGFGWRLKQ